MPRKRVAVVVGMVCASIAVLMFAVWFHMHTRTQAAYHQKDFVKILEASDANGYTDLAGKSASLSAYLGKPFVLFAWASWCPQCGDQLHLLSRLAGEQSFPIVALNRGETLETANAYLGYIQKPDNLVFVIDKADTAFSTMGGFAMPELVLYNSEGVEMFHSRGTLTEDEMRAVFGKVNGK